MYICKVQNLFYFFMRYQGSKLKLKKILKSIIESNLSKDTTYVEPFMGGCNSLAYIDHNKKLGIDFNSYIVALWQSIKNGTFNIPKALSEDEYYEIKNDYLNKGKTYPDSMIGYVGMACSYGGGWWNGYARYNEKKKEDHILEAYNGTQKQIKEFKHLDSTDFIYGSYDTVEIPAKSFIYCDPPYQDTKKYESDFDNFKFWEWCRKQVSEGHKVLVSEYNAPKDFVCIWEKTMQDGMGNNKNKKVERLFIHKSQKRGFIL